MAISNAPLVILASFHQHNSGTVAKHGRHIKYIATRPGVDRGATRDDLSPENIPVEAHTEYIAERPGSCGLFGYREISDHKEIQKELAGHKGLSWRFVVSLRADDATKMGYDNREKWEETLQSQINTVGEKMGISRNNLRWCAAFHVHPQQVNCHAHIVLWQKDVVRTTGKLNAQEMREIKKTFANEIYREERLLQMQEKSLMREYVRDNVQGSISKAKDLIRELRQAQKSGELELKALGLAGQNTLPPELIKEKELAEKLYSLAQNMPGHGRVALQFMPEEVKKEARGIADWIMQQPRFRQEVDKHSKAAEELARTYTNNQDKLHKAKEKAEDDLRDRIAQVALRGAVEADKLKAGTLIINEVLVEKALSQFSRASKKLVDQTPENILSKSAAIIGGLQGLENDDKQQYLLNVAQQLNIDKTAEQAEKMLTETKAIQASTANTAAVLKIAGMADRDVSATLKLQYKELAELEKIKAHDSKDIDRAIKYVNKRLSQTEKSADNITFTDQQWQSFTAKIKIKADNPWTKSDKSTTEIISENKEQVVELCKTAAVAADITKQEAGWTAFTMYTSLKMFGVEQSERQKITNDFVSRNNIKADTKAIFEKIDKTDDVNPAAGNATKYLQKTTWQRLASNLNTVSPYPWATKENPYHLDQAKMQKTIKKIKQADMANVPADKMQQIITQYTQLLVAARLPEPEIKKEIKAFTEKAGHTINIEQTYERAIKIDPIENMKRLAGSKDDVQDFLNKYAKALTALGKEPEEVKQLITAWDERSSSNVDELKIDRAVKKAVDEKAEAKGWKTQYFLGKQTWQDLTDRLGIKANWVWKRTRGPNISNIIWRSCWRAVQNERMQCEAQAEQQKLRQAQKKGAKQKPKDYSKQDREEGGREQER